MIGTRHEEYKGLSLPFVFFPNLKRTPFTVSREQNWHEDTELQLCLSGEGTVLLNGEKFPFEKGDVAVAGSNVIHYTTTEDELEYACLIISPDFCRKMGIDLSAYAFAPRIKSERLSSLILRLSEIYTADVELKTARLHSALLDILIELCGNHSLPTNPTTDSKAFEKVKRAINYVRCNYAESITLVNIAEGIGTDKFALCRDFKALTGKTVTDYLNTVRCHSAAEYIQEGMTVSEAAYLSGFSNLSYFTRTFKKHMGALPSEYRSPSDS